MTTNPTAKDLDLPQLQAMVATFCTTKYDVSDPDYDPTLPAVWAWATIADYASEHGVQAMATANDNGYTYAEIADALGVSKQAVGQRLLRARGARIKHEAPPRQKERLPGI